MISMKVVNKWNRRLLRAVRRSGSTSNDESFDFDTASVGSNEDDVRVNNAKDGSFTKNIPKRSRESIMQSLPPPGQLSQHSSQHLDLLYALAYPKKTVDNSSVIGISKKTFMNRVVASDCEEKADESQDVARDLSEQLADLVVSDNDIRT
jgi:hypothetical protein